MLTKNLIQAAANVVKITRLAVGDVVKIVEDTSYSEPTIYLGVVVDLLNNGEKSYVQIMRYKKSYNVIDCDIKTYSGDKDCTLFPASVDDIKDYLGEVITRIEQEINEADKKLSDKKEALKKAKDFVSLETSKQLQAASFKEITQQEYLQLKTSAAEGVF